jgi:hypothetical protein
MPSLAYMIHLCTTFNMLGSTAYVMLTFVAVRTPCRIYFIKKGARGEISPYPVIHIHRTRGGNVRPSHQHRMSPFL